MRHERIISILGLIILFSIVGYFVYISLRKANSNSDTLPSGYISIFHGDGENEQHETYIYKENNDHDNYGFYYINVTKTLKNKDKNEWIVKITDKGSVMWTDDVFPVAKKNNAYSYVTVGDTDNRLSIEDYMNIFLMN